MTTSTISLYGKIPRDVILSLKPMAGHLLTVITCLINRYTNELPLSLSALASDANMSKDSVVKYTKILESDGLIKVRREGVGSHHDVNIYSLEGIMKTVCIINTNLLPQVDESDTTSRQDRQQMSDKTTADVDETDTDYISSYPDKSSIQEEDENQFSFSGNNSEGDSGEMDAPREGDDPTLPGQDSSLSRLEALGITGKALEAAKLYPERVTQAIDLAEQRADIRNKSAFISKCIINGIFEDTIPDKKPDISDLTWSDLTEETVDTLPIADDAHYYDIMPESWESGYKLLREFGIQPDDAFENAYIALEMYDQIDKGYRLWMQNYPPNDVPTYLLGKVKAKKAPPYWTRNDNYTGDIPDWVKQQQARDQFEADEKAEKARRGKEYYTSGKWADIIDS